MGRIVATKLGKDQEFAETLDVAINKSRQEFQDRI